MKRLKTIISVFLIIAVAVTGASLYLTRYQWDVNDTQELYEKNVNSAGYENTVETAIPQTELYNVINRHFESPLPEGKTEKKAILIGYDGCRADVVTLARYQKSGISELLKDGASINLTYSGGVNYPEKNTQDTSTAPGWCSILTGKWADAHTITGNDITKPVEPETLLISLTESKLIESAAFITKWAGHFSRDDATYLLEKEYCEKSNLNVSFNKCDDDKASLDNTLDEIKKDSCADFIFTIFEQTDSTGHNSGFSFNNPKYKEAFYEIDEYGYETIEAIRSRATYETEDWLIIITSDHGGIKTGHGNESIQERMTFVVMNAKFD